jgi:tRNA U34 5-methylaminomethyl-2-thiouridine-forming methyltransferase MnmC
MLKIVRTKDNSDTLYHTELDEHYHSIKGAISESMHVFINAGLKFCQKTKLKILEIGFGTGLNLLLTLHENKLLKKHIYYETIDKYPLQEEIYNKLNYHSTHNELFLKIHSLPWDTEIRLTHQITVKKVKADLTDYHSNATFDLLYFDAFSPEKQKELWSENIFRKLYAISSKNAVLVTYSSKGTVKQALRNVGYTVQRLKGPSGKRHMIRAVKE